MQNRDSLLNAVGGERGRPGRPGADKGRPLLASGLTRTMVQEEGRLYNRGGGDFGKGGGEASESSVSSSGGVGEQGRAGLSRRAGDGDPLSPEGDMGREQPVTGGGEIGRKRQASSVLDVAAAAV